jgi:hypothetical protein
LGQFVWKFALNDRHFAFAAEMESQFVVLNFTAGDRQPLLVDVCPDAFPNWSF